MFNIRRQAMERRVQLCSQPGATCPPLTWTISNRLAEFAPFLLHWHFRCSISHLPHCHMRVLHVCSAAQELPGSRAKTPDKCQW